MLSTRLAGLTLGLFYTVAVEAGDSIEQRRPAGVVAFSDVLQWLFGLIFVLAVFGLCVWLLRKTGHFSIQSKSPLAVLGGLSLGMREKLVLVKVGDKQLLLGVTPGRVDKLMELDGDARLFLKPEADDDNVSFAARLNRVLRSKADG
ncbi:MAG: flagellar biosynthetic protein FliO [Methylomonas sp.]|nr:flagellar biosynthetic protein FliO [Methylomonas sp.]